LASGINPKVATLVTMVIVVIPAILLMRSSRVQAPLTSFAIAAVAGRLWTYHRYYDDMMLVFLVIALGVLALRHQSCRLLWMAFLAVGVSVWTPGRVIVLPAFQLVQISTWFIGTTILLVYAPTALSPNNSLVAPLGGCSYQEPPQVERTMTQ